jgi:hypothetical protein
MPEPRATAQAKPLGVWVFSGITIFLLIFSQAQPHESEVILTQLNIDVTTSATHANTIFYPAATISTAAW